MRVPALLVPLFAAVAAAQSVTVDFPDSVTGVGQGQYPIYTATLTNLIRGQSFCPSTFANLPTTPMICTRVGLQLAEVTGPVTYTTFQIRFGRSPLTTGTFSTAWAQNLPDQRLQVDLSGLLLAGGLNNTNAWFEWPLAYPFYFTPGDSVVLDLITQAAVSGQFLRTAIGTGSGRIVTTSYTGQPNGGAVQTGGGLKFRMVFEPVGLVQWGNGCPGLNNLIPMIGSTGQSTVGSNNHIVTLSNAFGGAPGAFLMGNPANFDIGGGCRIYNDLAFSMFMAISGSGPGNGTSAMPVFVPNNPLLLGFVADVQWGILDPGAPSFFGVVTSPGGKIVVY